MFKQKHQPASISPGESGHTSPGVLGGISPEAPENMYFKSLCSICPTFCALRLMNVSFQKNMAGPF